MLVACRLGVYPRLRGTMGPSNDAQCGPTLLRPIVGLPLLGPLASAACPSRGDGKDRRVPSCRVESLLAGQMCADYCRAVPTINLTDDELAAVTAALLAPSKTTDFPTHRASIRCVRHWESSRRPEPTAADVGAPIEIFLSSLNNGQDFTYWAMSG